MGLDWTAIIIAIVGAGGLTALITLTEKKAKAALENMQKTIDETNRRREKQLAYNEANGITPKQIKRAFNNALLGASAEKEEDNRKVSKAYIEPEKISIAADPVVQYMSKPQMEKAIERARKQMQEAAKKLEFIEAAQYRDELLRLEDMLKERWG